jgi:hypothetical protein
MKFTDSKKNIIIGTALIICAGLSFFGHPAPNFALGGGGSDLEPTKPQSIIGGVIFLLMSLTLLFSGKKKE